MLHLALITPDRVLYEGEADSVSLPTPDGEITVLPHHIPLISIVMPGTVLLRKDGEEKMFSVTRGVIEIDGTTLRILADSADRADELQEEAITAAKQRAEKLVRDRREDAEGFAEATALLERELARLQTIRRHRSHRAPPRSA